MSKMNEIKINYTEEICVVKLSEYLDLKDKLAKANKEIEELTIEANKVKDLWGCFFQTELMTNGIWEELQYINRALSHDEKIDLNKFKIETESKILAMINSYKWTKNKIYNK